MSVRRGAPGPPRCRQAAALPYLEGRRGPRPSPGPRPQLWAQSAHAGRRIAGPSIVARRLAAAIAAVVVALSVSAAWPRTAAASPEASRTEKIRLLDKLVQAPQLLVLGSSRAMRLDPALLRRLTGLIGFNAAVSSGTCADGWCFLHLIADRFPSTPAPRVIWMLDVEQFRARAIHPWLLSVPRLTQYIPAQFLPAPSLPASAGAPTPAGVSALPPAARTLPSAAPVSAVADQTSGAAVDYGYRRIYAPDGLLRWAPDDHKAAHGWSLADGIADSVHKYRAIYPRGFKGLGSMPGWFVRESIKLLNSQGVRPVIVLTPYQPRLLDFIAGRGWPRRHQQVLAFFAALRPSCDFVLLDMTRLSSFGGRASEFYDGTHGRAALMRKLARAVVRRSGSALAASAD
jgi:hypothetical protein